MKTGTKGLILNSTRNLFFTRIRFFEMYMQLLNQWLMTKIIFPKYYHYKHLPFSYILLIMFILPITVIRVFINILTKYSFLFLQWQECNISSTVRWVKSRCWTIKKKSDSSGRHLTLTRIKVTYLLATYYIWKGLIQIQLLTIKLFFQNRRIVLYNLSHIFIGLIYCCNYGKVYLL